MASSDARNLILNEIEESLIKSNASLATQSSSVQGTLTRNMESLDRDFAVSPEALRRVVLHGLDSRYTPITGHENTLESESEKLKSESNDSVVDEQLAAFFTQMESDNEYTSHFSGDRDKDSDFSPKDKALMIKLPPFIFESFLSYVKETRPALHQALQKHPLISGKYSLKQKSTRKNLRREKRDREKEVDAGKHFRGKKSDTQAQEEEIRGGGIPHSGEARKLLLACMIAKCIADGSVQAHLIAVAVLMHSFMGEEGVERLPAGNLLGALFERPTNAVTAVDSRGQDGRMDLSSLAAAVASVVSAGSPTPPKTQSGYSLGLADCNPFRSCLQTGRVDSQEIRGRRAESDCVSRDAGSQSTYDDRQSEMGSHYAPSNVGSLQAEHGTETASIPDMEQDHEDEDAEEVDEDEEEMLAQALAMSLGSDTASVTSTGEARSVSSPGNVPPLSESSLSILTDRQQRGIPEERCSPSTSQSDSFQEKPFGTSTFPTLPSVNPLSTFGPFCDISFWRGVRSDTGNVKGSGGPVSSQIMVPMQSAITALLVNVGASVDIADSLASANRVTSGGLEDASKGANATPPSSKTPPLTTSSAPGSTAKIPLSFPSFAQADPNKLPISHFMPISAHPVSFLLIELLLDMFLSTLSNLGAAPLNDDSAEDKSHGYPKDDTATAEAKYIADTDISLNVWKAKRHFVVWSVTILLKLLRASLSTISSLAISPSSVGLGRLPIPPADHATTDNVDSKPSVHLVDNILKHILECIGSDISPWCKCSGLVDSSVIGMQHEKVKYMSDRLELTPKHSNAAYRHALRVLGIEALSCGFLYFYTTLQERENILSFLFHKTVVCGNVESGMTPFGSLPNEYSSCFPVREEEIKRQQDSSEVNAPLVSDHEVARYSRSTEHYRNLLLQKLCLAIAGDDTLFCGEYNTKASMFRGKSSGVHEPSESSDDTPISDPDKQRILEHLRALLPRGIDASEMVLERMYDAVVEAQEHRALISSSPSPEQATEGADTPRGMSSAAGSVNDQEAMPDNSLGGNDDDIFCFTQSLERILISRLGNPELMLHYSKMSADEANPGNAMFFGEMCLLFKLQQKHAFELTKFSTTDDSFVLDLEFDSKRCNGNLKLADNNHSVSQTGSKTWSSVAASQGFSPGTGDHSWAVRLDKCERGHVFIGVTTATASMDTYVGGDKYGWGMIGTRALWHNRSKVKSSYGEGFSSRSVVYLRYDSNDGKLYYSMSTRGNWGVAFDNIPRETVFPTVSLYQRGDRITLLSVAPTSADFVAVRPLTIGSSAERPSAHEIFCSVLPFVSHCLIVLDQVEGIIKAAEGMDDIVRKRAALSHPFLSVLLPSLCAAISTGRCLPQHSCYISLQLLPHLTMLTRRLSRLHELNGAEMNSFVSKKELGFIGDISGKWHIHSAAAGNSIPAQEYTIALKSQPVVEQDENSTSRLNNSEYKAVKVSGDGKGGMTSVNVSGTVYGTRIKFQESWALGGSCFIEGRISLDGSYFSGIFKDAKSGSGGSLKAFRISQPQNTLHPYNCLLKISLLAAMACGKLASHLIVGMDPVPAWDLYDASLHNAAAQMASGGRYTESKDEGNVEDSKEDSDATPHVDESDSEPVGSQAEDLSNQCDDIRKWMSSKLFSGGLRMDGPFIDAMGYQLISYFNFDCSASRSAFLSPASARLKSWWIDTVFRDIRKYCTFASTNSPSSDRFTEVRYQPILQHPTSEIEHKSEDPFYTHLQENIGVGRRIDEHLLRHIGLSVLCKIGGEPMQSARRRVLVSLLHHTGCLSLCYAEDRALNAADRNVSDKPHPLLVDVWRASQRIVEHAIRQKQTTGVSYGHLSQELCKKAEFLLTIQPNDYSRDIAHILATVPSLPTTPRTGAESSMGQNLEDVQFTVSKCLAEVVEFFQVSCIDVGHLRCALFKCSLRAYSRSAGLQALILLLGKATGSTALPEDISPRLPVLSVLFLQSVVVEYIHPAFYGVCDFSSGCTYELGGRLNGNVPMSSGVSSEPGDDSSSSVVPLGHFTDSLQSAGRDFLSTLRNSFESMYELITQLLQRCTWAGDRDGQCIALSAWDIAIIPEDHAFLNRIGIFRVLQTVLDDARASLLSQQTTTSESSCPDKDGDISSDSSTHDIIVNANRRLSQLSLRVVHTLASQVAFCKDGSGVHRPPSLHLQRHPSGPETLSQALFDMLYSELYNCMKHLIVRTCGGLGIERYAPVSTAECSNNSDCNDELEGGKYAYRILRLLYFVSESAVCQRYLSTPKWLTLLVASIGFGDLGVQRRLMRLLRRLLISMKPENVRLYMNDLFARSDEIVLSDEALDEDDVDNLILASQEENGLSCAEKLLSQLLEAASVTVTPPTHNHDNFMSSLHSVPGGATSLSAECISLIRLLEDVPAWKDTVVATLRRPLQRSKDYDKAALECSSWNQTIHLRMVSGVFSVLGGHIDRLRVGGTVTLKPFSLVGTSETFALRLAAVSHSCGMLVSKSVHSNSVEVVLMERSRKMVKSEKEGVQRYSTQYSMSLSGSLPLRTVKMSIDDVVPAPDFPPPPDFFDASLLLECLEFLEKYSLPLVKDSLQRRKDRESQGKGSPDTKKKTTVDSGAFMALDDPDDDDDNDDESDDNDVSEDLIDYGAHSMQRQMLSHLKSKSDDCKQDEPMEEVDVGDGISDINALQFYTSTVSFRAIAEWLQFNTSVMSLCSDNHQILREILAYAVSETTIGGLSEIEAMEERWAVLWEAYSAPDVASDEDKGDDESESTLQQLRSRLRAARSSSTESTSGRSSRDVMSASMLASMLSTPSSADAARARDQMMEMGFPKEWCEVALRRCRYNVEMAINLCFEHGSEMNQIVAEEAAYASAASSARAGSGGMGGNRYQSPRSNALGIVARLASGGRRVFSGSEGSRRQQLMDMGFPPSWCMRALEANHNDVDAALTWILSHGEELAASDEDRLSDRRTGKENEDEKDESVDYGPNPLSTICGVAAVKSDMSCGGSSSTGFPSVGCRGFHVTSGKWYYEVYLETAGCMQFGWADLAYEGACENGEGVGDCSHSWAYDGWRKLLWNEASTEWGAKWARGDTIGCAVDMDNLTMSFYLNGYGQEISMGVAFERFSYCGGLYPCFSFNRNERCQLNFGYRPFKHTPPTGYSAFIDHVKECLASNTLMLQSLLAFTTKRGASTTDDNTKGEDLDMYFEDCLEEQRGESDFLSHKRYFHPEDSSRGSNMDRNSLHVAASILSAPVPSHRASILNEFEKMSTQLCVLYSRLIILRLMTARSRNNSCDVIVSLLAESMSALKTGEDCPPSIEVDRIMFLLRESSASCLRTRVYLQTMSILAPNSLPPPNLGSVLTCGGAPMLTSVQNAFSAILSRLRQSGDSSMINCMLQQVYVETLLSTKREYAVEWKVEGGIAPVIYKDAISTEIDSKAHIPSLVIAVWLSSSIMKQLTKEIQDLNGDMDAVICIVDWIRNLIESWTLTLKSPVLAVKTCGARQLSTIIQELYFGDSFHPNIRYNLNSIISNAVPLERIERVVIRRMEQEKGSQPVCSEYLQSMIELAITARACVNYSDDKGLFPDQSESSLPLSVSETSNEVDDFNWDAICGSLLSDDGWEVWSGVVHQLEAPFTKPPATPLFSRSKQEIPPALLPGCKVARFVGKSSKSPSKVSEDSGGCTSSEERRPRSSILQMLGERLTSGDSSDTTEHDIGTVIEVCEWEDCGPGSGRVVEWNNGGTEHVRWGADGVFDVIHVAVDSNDKIQTQYPCPLTAEKRAAKAGFASDTSYGIILRLRSLPRHNLDDEDIGGRFDGLMEWPDFRAIVYVTGIMYTNGHWTLTEEKLIKGSENSDWTIRFGESHWKSGTTYDLSLPRFSGSEETVNSLGRHLLGHFHYPVTCFRGQTVHISGDIKIQQSRLFTFDPQFHASSVMISHDQLAAACSGAEGKCCAYASVGFSTGVHYWEFKIEQCDLGNIFIGVAEKPPKVPGSTPPRLNRWYGYGFVNLRSSYRHTSASTGEKVYGDLFQTGDTVGVLLDMNRGRLSFFLDAMKYGEHSLTDLGEAFDGLNAGSSFKVQPKTLYPVVGFKRSGDRVTITPRWVSSTGNITMHNEFRNVSRAWNLLSSWSEERPSSKPQEKDMWTYREAWRDWLRWNSNRFMKVRTRCKALNLMVGLDISPRACVDASIRLGLSTALFHGDRVVFTRSSGRTLETKEEAVILGSYHGQLWYRLDAQSGEGAMVEGAGLAWFFAAHDMSDLHLVRRGNIVKLLPETVVNIELARIPAFHGGRLRIVYEGGAVMRGGLEIDASDVTATVDTGAVVYALERRINSSNIARFLVYYEGAFGWISERIRGGNEEFMVNRVTNEPQDIVSNSIQLVVDAARTMNRPERVVWKDVATTAEAMSQWCSSVAALGYEKLLSPGEILAESYHKDTGGTFEDFLELSTTVDGINNWPVESDMLLTDMLSRVSSKAGQSPFNISCQQVVDALHQLDDTSPLRSISTDRIIARSSVIRSANVILGYALPYLELTLPEEKWRQDVFGCSSNSIDIINTDIPATSTLYARSGSDTSEIQKLDNDMNFLGDNYNQLSLDPRTLWSPPCCARRLRSKRRVLFTQTKRLFWENIIEATTTSTPLHQDEYEDPREIKVIRVNRVKATQARLGSISNSSERLRQSVFGQLHREMRLWPASSFRRSYLGKGHGGQKRAFKVKFLGEGVNDYGGPYRAVFEQVVDEVQCDSVVVGRKTGDRCLLPLLVPCPNRTSAVGPNQDKFLLSSSPTSPLSQELMQFFGKLSGTALRHNMNMGLDLSSLLWRPLVRLAVARPHLETVDTLAANSLSDVEKLGLTLEQDPNIAQNSAYVPKEWADLFFSVTFADGTKLPLVPGGEDIPVNLGNWRDYIRLVEKYRLRESYAMYRSFREGLASVIPAELFPMFTPTELEQLICGSNVVDIKLLQQCTEYEDINPESELVKNFWAVLEEMTDDERTLFLRFVWARSRMPASAQDLLMNFKLQAVHGEAESHPDDYLPHAQTCFFSLGLPAYSSKEVLRKKLIYAIHNSPNMDADVRLHNAEGWADS